LDHPDDRFSFVADATTEPGNILPALAALLIGLAEREESQSAPHGEG
jgi:hypothetical protein